MKDSKFYIWNKSGSKMIINSEFKEFNKQTNLITSGNVIANTMYGNYIRPWNETECNGLTFEKGKLFESDLKYFKITQTIKDYIKGLNREIILYEIFIVRDGLRNVIGWIIQDGKQFTSFINSYSRRNSAKRYSALKIVKNILQEKI